MDGNATDAPRTSVQRSTDEPLNESAVDVIDQVFDDEDDAAAKDGKKSSSVSCVMMLLGCILFPGALALVAFSEREYVCKMNMILEAENSAYAADCGDAAGAEGKLTFYSCPIEAAANGSAPFTPTGSFNLPGLGESVQIKSPAVAQTIEMYQCIEDKEEVKEEVASSLMELQSRGRQLKPHAPRVREFEPPSSMIRIDNRRAKASKLEHGSLQVDDPDEEETAEEESSKGNGKTKYYYKMDWSGEHYNSEDYVNPPQNIKNNGCPDFVVNGKTNHNPPLPDRGDGDLVGLGRQEAHQTSVRAGAFTFADEKLMKNFKADTPVSMLDFGYEFGLSTYTDNVVSVINKETLSVHPDNADYLSTCKTKRQGCLQIQYLKTNATHMTVFGLAGSSGVISPFKPKHAMLGCKEKDFIRMWPMQMTKEEAVNAMKLEAWEDVGGIVHGVLAYGGVLLAWWALYCFCDPIASGARPAQAVLSCLPGTRWLESGLAGRAWKYVCIMSCSVGLSCALVIIGLLWCVAHPIRGAPFLTCALLFCLIGCSTWGRGGKKLEEQPLVVEQPPVYTPEQVEQMGFNQ